MAFDNIAFPLSVASFSSQIGYQTNIITMDSGNEQRAALWDDARIKFDAASAVTSTSTLSTLISFFRARKGSARGFLVKDWSDYQVTNEAVGNYVTGTLTYQLKKTYSDAYNSDVRIISKPKSGTVSLYVNAVPKTEGTHYTINYATGIITFLVAQTNGAVITWTGEFYVPCRFAEDTLRADLILYKITTGLGKLPNVPLIEIRDIA